jgi:hypothetical protein
MNPAIDFAALADELQSVEDSLKSKIEKLYGKIETTDFAGEFKMLMDVHDKIQALMVSK